MKAPSFVVVISIFAFLVSCADQAETPDVQADSVQVEATPSTAQTPPVPVVAAEDLPSVPDRQPNTLTQAEREGGWKLLFDGQSLTGWKMYRQKPNNSWSVRDGVLYCKGSTTDKSDLRTDIITEDEFGNFELQIEWKISAGGNSGLMYLVSETAEAAYLTGPEYQMIDDQGFPEKLEDWQKSGANYAMHPPAEIRSKPAGEWNHTRVVVQNGKVEHWLNGAKVVEYEFNSEDWKKRKAEGKWKDVPSYGVNSMGQFALQDHGSEAWFRNILIREIE